MTYFRSSPGHTSPRGQTDRAPSVAVDNRGLLHDREWAAYTSDGGIASGKTTRRFRRVDGLFELALHGGPRGATRVSSTAFVQSFEVISPRAVQGSC